MLMQHAYQFLTGRAQRTMRIHLLRTAETDGEETHEVLFSSFAAFPVALDGHFSATRTRNTAALNLDRFRQGDREFGAYYAGSQELLDILDHADF